MPRRTQIILAALGLGLAGLGGVALSGEVEDRWLCLAQLDRFKPHDNLWLKVPAARKDEFIGVLGDLSDTNDLLFAADFYPALDPQRDHDRNALQACNRFINIIGDNTHRSDLFAVYIGRNPKKVISRFEAINASVTAGLTSRFERASAEEIEAAQQ